MPHCPSTLSQVDEGWHTLWISKHGRMNGQLTYIFATINYKVKDLGVISKKGPVVVETAFSSVFSSVGRGPALACAPLLAAKDYERR